MNQQPMQNPKPAVPTWLWVVLGVVVVAGAAFFAWWFLMGPGKKTTTTTTPTATTSASIYKNTDYNFQLSFSDDWKGYKVVKQPTSQDVIQASYKVWVPVPSTTYKQQTTDMKGYFNPLTIEVLTTAAWDDGNGGGVKNKGFEPSGIKPEFMGTSGSYTIVYERNDGDLTADTGTKFKDTLIPALVKTFKTTTASTTTTTTTDLTYTNSTYGFTMTFPAAWKGYKFKEANISGATMTYYVEIPSTDASATGDSTADKGYYSPFAISVYTLDEWATVEASEGPKDTLITKNTKYAFGWSQANGVPPTDFTTAMQNEIKTIIASFKLK